jgi:hypothetical protein
VEVGDSMHVNDAKKILLYPLVSQPLTNGAQVIADV